MSEREPMRIIRPEEDPAHPIQEIRHDGEEVLHVCAQCDQDAGVRHVGNVSHGICERHAEELRQSFMS